MHELALMCNYIFLKHSPTKFSGHPYYLSNWGFKYIIFVIKHKCDNDVLCRLQFGEELRMNITLSL